jgi:phosphatidate cytidylyltransferase
VAKRQPHGAIDNLNTRVNAWWVMSIVVGMALLAGKAGVTLLFAFASFVALREFVAPAPT